MTWTREQELPTGPWFYIKTNTIYRIDKIKEVKGDKIGMITANLNGNVIPQPPPGDANQEMKIISSDFTGTSSAMVNLEKGFTIRKQNEVRLTVNARVISFDLNDSTDFGQQQVSKFSVELIR